MRKVIEISEDEIKKLDEEIDQDNKLLDLQNQFINKIRIKYYPPTIKEILDK